MGPPWAATLGPLLALAAAVASGSNMLAPSLSAIATDLGVPAARREFVLGGLAASMFWLVGAPLSLGAGFLTDAVSRKAIGVAVGVAAAAVHASLACVTTVPALLTLRAAHGALFGTLQPLLLSVVGDVCPPHRRPAVASAVGLAIGGGTAVGQLVAGAMAARTGWRAPLGLAAGLCAASAAALWRLGREPPREGGGAGGGNFSPLPPALEVAPTQKTAAASATTTTSATGGAHKGRHRAGSSDPAAALLAADATAASAAAAAAGASAGSDAQLGDVDAAVAGYRATPPTAADRDEDNGGGGGVAHAGRSSGGVALTARRVTSHSPTGGSGRVAGTTTADLHRDRLSSATRAATLSRSVSPHDGRSSAVSESAAAPAAKPRLPWRRRAAAAWAAVPDASAVVAAAADARRRLRGALAWAAGEAAAVCAVHTNALVFAQSLPGTVPWGVIGSFLPDYLAADKGFTVGQATLLILAFAVGAVVGGVAGGLLGSRVHRARPAYVPLLFGALQAASAAPVIALLNMPPVGPHQGGALTKGAGGPPPRQPWSAVTTHALAAAAGVLASATGPNLRALLLNVNPPQARGGAVTLAYVCDSVAKGVAPALVGLAVASSHADRAAVFSAAAGCWVLSGAIIAAAARTVEADEAAAVRATAAAAAVVTANADAPSQLPDAGSDASAATAVDAQVPVTGAGPTATDFVRSGAGGDGVWRKLKTSPPPTTVRGKL